MSRTNIDDLRRFAFLQYVQERIQVTMLGEMDDFGVYITALVEEDWDRIKDSDTDAESDAAANVVELYSGLRPNPGPPAMEALLCSSCGFPVYGEFCHKCSAGPEQTPESATASVPVTQPASCSEEGCASPVNLSGAWCDAHDSFGPDGETEPATIAPVATQRPYVPRSEVTYAIKCPDCRKPAPYCKCAETAPPTSPNAEIAAREWIFQRSAQASSKSGETPGIDLVAFMEFTGWPKSRATQFVHLVQDEIRADAKSARPSEVGISALIAAVNAPPEDDDAEDEASSVSENSAAGIKLAPVPPYVINAGYASLREYQAGVLAKKECDKKGKPFDQSAWIIGYRQRAALRALQGARA